MGGSASATGTNITPDVRNIDKNFTGQTLPTFNNFFSNQPLLSGAQGVSLQGLQEVWPAVLNQLLPVLQSGGALTAEQNRDVTQATRAGFAARGNVMGNQALGSELLNRDQFRQQRFGTAEQQTLQALSGTVDPALQTEQTATQSFATLINPLYNLFEVQQQDNLQAQIANQNKQAGLIGGGIDAIGSVAGAALKAGCDERFKENIRYTGRITGDGIPEAEFNYIGEQGTWVGVIAQDVEKIVPEAVIMSHGYRFVDFSKLSDPVMHRKLP